MSWDQIWTLPRSRYTKDDIDRAVNKAAEGFVGVKLSSPVAELEDSAEDFAADDEQGEGFTYTVLIPEDHLADAGDEPEEEPGDDGCYECVFSVRATIGEGEAGRWQVHVDSNEAQNRDANLAVSAIAARVSVLLGGSDDPEEI